MIEIGQKAPEFRGDGSTIKGVVEGLKHNKIRVIHGTTAYLDLGVANKTEYLEILPFNRWKVIGFGMIWGEASTANEDPVVEFGRSGDYNAYGTMTSAITGGEKFCTNDHQKYDPVGILAPEIITEASATLVVTWTKGAEFDVWSNDAKRLLVIEAAVAGMTTGTIWPYIIAEVDTGGKW